MMTTPKDTPPVDRLRRFRFVAAVVTFCLLAAGLFTLLAALGGGIPIYNIELIEMFIGGCLSIATATTLAYITGSVIDYNSSGVFNRSTKRADYVLPATEAKG